MQANTDDWRVDRIRSTGETDLFRQQGYTIRWVFESETATYSPVSKIRLPDAADLLGLAAALMRRPPLLILDEPSNGLDPQGSQEIRSLLLQLNCEGTTIFLSSDLLAEIEQMCTHVGVLHSGRLMLQERLDTLLRPTGLVAVRTPDTQRCLALLGSSVVTVDGDRLLVQSEEPARLNSYWLVKACESTKLVPAARPACFRRSPVPSPTGSTMTAVRPDERKAAG